jgi:hypothetical protein
MKRPASATTWTAAFLLAAAAAPPAGAFPAAAGGASSLLGDHLVEGDPETLLSAAFRLRHPAACLAFGSSRARRPVGARNSYELGLVETEAPLWLPERLHFLDNPGANDVFQRSLAATRVFDSLARGDHEISWLAEKGSADAEDLNVERSELAVLCAKRELPWRDEGTLPASARAALGGFTGADQEVTSDGHYDPLIQLRFTPARPIHCIALASGNAVNPASGGVDQRYELLLSRAGEAGALPVQRVEHDDDALVEEPLSVPVAAVRFFPDLEPEPQTFTWWGIKESGQTHIMSVEYPSLAVACARARLGAEPFHGGSAVGGAHRTGPTLVTSDSPTELVALDFTLRRPSTCVAFASASAVNPAGGTLDNLYHFRLSAPSGAGSWDMLLEFDDNDGIDDVGVLQVAHTFAFRFRRGAQTIRFEALKDAAGDADLAVESPSLAVFCASRSLTP